MTTRARDTQRMVAVLILLLWLMWGLLAARSREKRNRSQGAGWALGLLFGPLGWLIAALQAPVAAPVDMGTMARCPHCAELVQAAAVKCKHCGSNIP